MRFAAIVWLALCLIANTGSAAIVLSITQDTPGPINLGDSAVFSIFVSSNSGTINNLSGLDFQIDANDPTFTGTGLAGGHFTSGTNDLFAPGGGFQAAYPSSFQIFGANAGGGLTITSTPTKVASLRLSTAGATPGTYALNLSGLLAVDPLFNSLPTAASGALNYTIQAAAVPEPSSLLLLVAGAGLVGRRCWRRVAK